MIGFLLHLSIIQKLFKINPNLMNLVNEHVCTTIIWCNYSNARVLSLSCTHLSLPTVIVR